MNPLSGTLLATYLLANTAFGLTGSHPVCAGSRIRGMLGGHEAAQGIAALDMPVDDQSKLGALEVGIKAERYAEIEAPLRAYVAEHPRSWRAHYDLGYVLFRRHDGTATLLASVQDSIKELSRSLELNLSNADAHKILALDFTMIQREDLAEIELKQAVHLDPTSAESHYFLGRHYMGESRYVLAKTELEAAVRLDPTYMKAHENLGITLDRMGDAPDALKEYLRAIELDEQQAKVSELPYLDLAKFYQEQNKLDLGLEYASKALERNSRSDDALYELALLYRERKEWDAAVAALDRAIGLNPREAQYYFLLGRTYSTLRRKKESQEAFSNYLRYKDSATAGSPPGRTSPDQEKSATSGP